MKNKQRLGPYLSDDEIYVTATLKGHLKGLPVDIALWTAEICNIHEAPIIQKKTNFYFAKQAQNN